MMVYGKENNTAILVKTFATLNHLHMICAFSNNPLSPSPPPNPWTVCGGTGLKLQKNLLRDLSEISRGEGGGKQKEGHNVLRLRKGRVMKMAVKRGRVMQIYACDHIEVHPQKKKEVLCLVKKPGRNRRVE